MHELLARHDHDVRANRVRCPNPNHEDRHPSESVFEGRDGERLHCFSCGFDGDVIDVARAIGMNVKLGVPEPVPKLLSRLSCYVPQHERTSRS